LNPDGSVPIGKTKLSAGEYSVEISSGTKTLLPFKAVIKSKKPKSSEDDESKFDDVDSSIKDEEKSNNEDSKNEDEVELVDLSETQKEQNVSTRYEKIGTQQNFDTKPVVVDQIDSVSSNNLSDSQKNTNNELSDNNDEESQSFSYQKLQENQIQSANQEYESNSQNYEESSSQSGQIDNTQSPLTQSSNPDTTQRQIDEVKGVSITPEPTPINKDVKGETSVTVPEYRSVSGNTEVVLNSDPGVSGDTTVPQITNTAARGTLNGISAPGTSNYEAQNLSQPQQIIQTDRIQNTSGSEDKSNTLSGTSLESDNYADQDIYKSVGSDTIDQNKINSQDSNESTDIVENNYSSDEQVSNKLTANRLQNDSNLSLEDSQKKLTNETQTSLDYVSLPESNLYPDNKNLNLSESDTKISGVTGDNTVIRNEYVGASGETNVNLSEGSQVRGETSVNINPTLGVSGEFTNNTEFSKSASGTFDSRNQNKIISNTNQISDGVEEKLSPNATNDTSGSIYKKLEPGEANYDENVAIENNESNNQITLSRISQNTSVYQDQNPASQTNPISQTQDNFREQNNNQRYRNVTDEFGNVFQVDEFGNKISSPDFSYEQFDNTNNQEYASANNLRYGTIDGISSVESQEANQTEQSYKEASSQGVNYSDPNQKPNANLQYGDQGITYVSNRTAQPNMPGVSRLNKSDSSDTNQSQPSDKKINFIKKLSMSINRALGIEPQSVLDYEQLNNQDFQDIEGATRIVSPKVTGILETPDSEEDEEEKRLRRKNIKYQKVGFVEPELKVAPPIKLDDETMAYKGLYEERGRFDFANIDSFNSAVLRRAEEEIEKQSILAQESSDKEVQNQQASDTSDLENIYYIELVKERQRLEKAFDEERESNRLAIRKSEDSIQQQLLNLILNNQNLDTNTSSSDPVDKLVQTLINEDNKNNSEQIVIDATKIVQMIQNQITENNGQQIDEYWLRRRIEDELKTEFAMMQKDQEKKMKIVYKKMIEDMYIDMINS
jgi:hypothetical protein